ncbi:MAG TPA: hypothetical protein VG096_12730 [Bryobacteraceae bacterium]|nr:hypothetical protein [Bryobacteraceae bacterium]
MRSWRWLLLFPAALAAQPPQSVALLSGVLLERDTQAAAGEFAVRASDNQVFRYRFDAKTYVEREQLPSSVARLQPGDKVQVISDEVSGTLLRYARTIHVLETPPPTRPVSQGRLRVYRSLEERAIPTGTLTYAGVIFRLNAERMVIHTRGAGDQTILLRQDTRYLEDGDTVEPGVLRTNMRVFVRAGRTLFNEIEAYQVVWGQILMPR